jgi:hypothetical protein
VNSIPKPVRPIPISVGAGGREGTEGEGSSGQREGKKNKKHKRTYSDFRGFPLSARTSPVVHHLES